jgi:hypothetical protein
LRSCIRHFQRCAISGPLGGSPVFVEKLFGVTPDFLGVRLQQGTSPHHNGVFVDGVGGFAGHLSSLLSSERRNDFAQNKNRPSAFKRSDDSLACNFKVLQAGPRRPRYRSFQKVLLKTKIPARPLAEGFPRARYCDQGRDAPVCLPTKLVLTACRVK